MGWPRLTDLLPLRELFSFFEHNTSLSARHKGESSFRLQARDVALEVCFQFGTWNPLGSGATCSWAQ